MSTRSYSSLALLLAIGTQASAATNPFTFHQKVFPQDPSLSCQIKRFTVTEKKDSLTSTVSVSKLTSIGAVIETTKPDCIREYAVVQFIKGCVYSQTYKKSTNEVSEKFWDANRDSRGGTMAAFTFPEWAVDTNDVDPMYQSTMDPNRGRMDYYYVAKIPFKLKSDLASLRADDEIFQRGSNRISLKNPLAQTTTHSFVTDMPDPALYYQGVAPNGRPSDIGFIAVPSLDFKICVYETKDIPLSGDPASPETPHEQGGPLQCYDWSHKYEFNKGTMNFDKVTTPGTDAFCLSPTPTPDPTSGTDTASPRVIGSGNN